MCLVWGYTQTLLFLCFSALTCCCCTKFFSLLYSHCEYQDFKIQNIVGSCDVKFPIRLEGLAYSHGAFSSVSNNSPMSNSVCWLASAMRLLCRKSSVTYHHYYFAVWTWALSRPNLSHEAAKNCAAYFCLGKNCDHRSQGKFSSSCMLITGPVIVVDKFFFKICLAFLGKGWDIHSVWEYIPCPYWVQEGPTMVCAPHFLRYMIICLG